MKAGRETSEHTFRVEHIGFEADFYHPQGKNLKLGTDTVERYEMQKEDAEIFIQHASATAFNSDEILSWFLLQTNTTLADHLPQPSLGKPSMGQPVFVTFPIRFDQGVFHMDTEHGSQDLRALNLLVRVEGKAKTNS